MKIDVLVYYGEDGVLRHVGIAGSRLTVWPKPGDTLEQSLVALKQRYLDSKNKMYVKVMEMEID